MTHWTDYPVAQLGDEPYEEAPIRRCKVLSYDGDKYCCVRVGGVEIEIKRGYIYRKPGRAGKVPRRKSWRLKKKRSSHRGRTKTQERRQK